MQPLFGCDVQSLLFRRANTSTLSLYKDLIASAIIEYEPRIDLEEITTTLHQQERQRVDVTIIYTIRMTNVRTNLVYPFYFLEGTDLREVHSL